MAQGYTLNEPSHDSQSRTGKEHVSLGFAFIKDMCESSNGLMIASAANLTVGFIAANLNSVHDKITSKAAITHGRADIRKQYHIILKGT